jgi:hypothetical protein
MTHCMLQVQESMMNPLQVTQEIYQLQDHDTDPNPNINVQAETTASTSQPPSISTSNSHCFQSHCAIFKCKPTTLHHKFFAVCHTNFEFLQSYHTFYTARQPNTVPRQ